MRKVLLIRLFSYILVASFFASCKDTTSAIADPDASSVEQNPIEDANHTTSVWVCNSASAKRYHANKDCGGLKRCKHEIVVQEIAQAEAIGLTRCAMSKCE